jgi:hypothetical protein
MRTRLRRLHVESRAFTWRAEIHHAQGSGDCHRPDQEGENMAK